LVRVLDPWVGLVYYPPAVPVVVDPLGELPERVSRLHVVGESEVRELQLLVRADQVGVLPDRLAVGQPYAPPPALAAVAVLPEGDPGKRVPFLDLVPLEPI
jgi:hypothetical protein